MNRTTPRVGIVKNGSLLDAATPGGLWLQEDGTWGPRQTARRFRSDAEADAVPGHDCDGIFPFSAPRRLRRA